MKRRTPISKIMTSQLSTVNTTQGLRDVKKIIEEENVHHVPVVSGNEVIGMISKSDLQRISFVNDMSSKELSTAMYDALTIEQVMTKNLKTVQEDDTIFDVAVILSKNEFHALPVVKDNKLVGIVTTTDMLKFLIDQF